MRAAAADVATVEPFNQPFVRYLANPGARVEVYRAVVFALNASVSRSPVNVVPDLVGGGELIRINLRQIAQDDPKRLPQVFALWESLVASEPYFYIPGEGTIEVEEFCLNGQPITSLGVRTIAPHYDQAAANTLHQATKSLVPILRADWFVKVALTTLDGGRYYDLIGLRSSTTQKEYLASRGASEEQVALLGSDERAALFRSKVTGKPRRIDMFRGAGVRPSVGTGLVAITHDAFDEDVSDPNFDPTRNLLAAVDRGREIIVEKVNGWSEYTLWAADGSLVLSAPDNLAVDHITPSPHTKRLEPAFSCIRCHGDHEGWQPFENDVLKLIGDGFNAFGDVAQDDSVRRLAGLYSGDLSQPLRLARNSLDDVVFRATQVGVTRISQDVSTVVAAYTYDLVDAHIALRELGVECWPELAPVVFNIVIPRLPETAAGVSPEDPLIRALASGLGINRRQFETIYADLATRIQPHLAPMPPLPRQ